MREPSRATSISDSTLRAVNTMESFPIALCDCHPPVIRGLARDMVLTAMTMVIERERPVCMMGTMEALLLTVCFLTDEARVIEGTAVDEHQREMAMRLLDRGLPVLEQHLRKRLGRTVQ